MVENTGTGWRSKIRNGTGETDSDTRGHRLNRKSNILRMLPATTAIVNVYQLFDKTSHGGKGEKTLRNELGSRSRGTSGRFGGNSPKVPKIPKEKNPGLFGFNRPQEYVGKLYGEDVDTNGNLMKIEGESKHEFNSRNTRFRNINKIPMPIYVPSNFQSKSKTKETAENAKQRQAEEVKEQEELRSSHLKQQAEVKQKEREQHAKNPSWQLWDRVKSEGVIHQPKYGKYENDKEHYYILDPLKDASSINNAMDNAKTLGKLTPKPGQPEHIIAIQPQLSEPPRYYAIRRDIPLTKLSELRRKKLIKRSAVRKSSTSHGNKKRKVVLKKKGGKR